MNVKLRRKAKYYWTGMAKPRGVSMEPFLLTVSRRNPSATWVVESDTERFFNSLRDAQRYVNTFFEGVKDAQA